MSRVLSLALTALLLMSCQTAPFVWVDDLPERSSEPPAYRLRAGDEIKIDVYGQKELSVARIVRPDGHASVPLIGDVPVGGLTPSDAAASIVARLTEAELVLSPKVSIAVEKVGVVPLVTVLGEVKEPGQYALDPDDNLLEVLGKAKGLTEFAALDSVYVIREGHAPPRIRFSYKRLSRGLGTGLTFRLLEGDVVVVE